MNTTTKRHTPRLIVALIAMLALLASVSASLSEAAPTVGNYVLVSEQRVSRTHSDFTYRASLTNDGAPLTNVQATLTGVPANVAVVEGSLTFGNVGAAATVQSTDTFTIRIDRQVPFNSAALVWTLASTPGNSPPTANAGPNDTAFVGDTVSLNGAGSTDVDGNPLTFAWSFVSRPAGSTATLQSPASVTPTFVLDRAGTYVIQLVVNDGFVNSAPDTVSISTLNSPPVANAGPDQSTFVGSVVSLSGAGSTDVDGNALTFAWSLITRPAGSTAVLSSASVVAPTFTVDRAGTYIAQLVVNDGTVNSAPDTVIITTLNRPPTANAGPDQSVALGATVQLNGSGSTDLDGNALTFAWALTVVPSGSTATLLTPTIANPTFIADRPGTYVAQLIVNDGTVNSAPDTVTISTDNSAPTANAGPDQNVTQGATVQLNGSASSDPDGTALQFFWSLTTRPAGSTAALSNANSVNPTFVADQAGTYIAQLIVSDGVLNSAPDTVSITAAATPVVTVAAVDPNAAEAGLDPGTFRFTRTGSLVAALTVSYAISGSATNGVDYATIGTSIVIPAGQASADRTITPIDDTAQEGDETVVLTIVPGTGYVVGIPSGATVTIAENDFPTVTVAATDASAAEDGPSTGTFTFTRTGPTTLPLTVNYTVGGTATSGVDYGSIGTSVTLGIGVTSVTRTVTPIADTLVEGNETVVVTLAAGQYINGSPSSATVTIADSVPTITVTATDASAAEDPNDTGTFTFTRTGPTTLALTVNYTVGGTATVGTDYTSLGTSVTIPAGQTTATRTVAPIADTLVEGSETVVVTLAAGQYVVGTPSSATVTIAESVPTVTVVATDANAREDGPTDTGTFTFTRTGPTTLALIVNYTVAGTATAGVDYSSIGTSVTIPAGQTSVTRTVTPFPDTLIEGNETVVVTLSTGQYVIGTPSSATVTIADTVATVTLAATDANASEAGDTGTFTFTRTGPTTLSLIVNYTVGGTATAGVDYSSIGLSVTIPAGQTSVTRTVTAFEDTTVEGSETVVVTLATGQYIIGTPNTGTVTITESVPTVTVTATDANAREDGPNDPGTFTFTRTGSTTLSLIVNYTVGGTATAGVDYSSIGLSVTIPAGQTSVTRTVTPNADTAVEGNETVVVTLATGQYIIGTPSTATVTIAESVPTVTVTATDANAREDGPNDPGTFTFTRTGPTTLALIVNYTVGGSATAGVDYSSIGTSVSIPAGQTSVTRTVTPIADTAVEGNETVVVTLAAGDYVIGTPSTATVTIAESVPTVTVTATDANAREDGPNDPGTFTFTRTGPTTLALIVNYTVGGSATAGVDYSSIGTSVTIPAGQTSVTRTVTPIADTAVEGNETVVVTLAAGEYVAGTPSSATVTIAESVPTVTVTATDANAAEAGADPGTFTFTRTGPTTLALTVNFTVGGTATLGVDYASPGNAVTIQAGQSSATRTVTPIDDAVVEGAETVVVTLAAGSYVIGTPNTATVTITSNE